jgi:cyclic beta-1,2-glucan synthetase
MYRLGLEAILGVRRLGGTLRIDPCIPRAWPKYQVTYRSGTTTFEIRVENPSSVNRGVKQLTLDGKVLPGTEIPLLADGATHQVNVVLGSPS